MAEPIDDRGGRNDVQGGRRPRQAARRPHRVEFSLTGEELELLEAAAERAGQARGAYAAEAALAAAGGKPKAAIRTSWPGGGIRPSSSLRCGLMAEGISGGCSGC